MDTSLVVRWSGGELRFQPGSTPSFGRGADVDIRCANTAVSRRHASVAMLGGVWVLRDLGSSQGTWRDGNRVESVEIRGTVQVTLGREGQGEVVVLESAAVGSAHGGPPGTPGGGGFVGVPGGPTELTGAGAIRAVAGTVIVGDGASAASADATAAGGGPARPGGVLRQAPGTDATVVSTPSLKVSCEGGTDTYGPDAHVTIGREDGNDVRLSHPSVSRHHARILYEGSAWVVEDLGSSGGTYVEGERISRLVLSGATDVRLGDPADGAVVSVVPNGAGAASSQPPSTKRRPWSGWSDGARRGVVVGAAVAAVALVAVVALLGSGGGGGPTTEDLTRATVRVVGEDRAGSGTVIDAEMGLILTNAHVAAPSTPGRAASVGVMGSTIAPNPRELVVEVSEAVDQEVEPHFLAEVVAADGYLDLAVLRITKTSGGRLVEPGSSDLDVLVDVEPGDGDAVSIGTDIRVFSVADTRMVVLAKGTVSSAIQDERIGSSRAMLTVGTNAPPGRSGGGAYDADGRIVGIRTFVKGEDVPRVRPISLALPLVEAARAEADYESPYYRPLDSERVEGFSISEAGPARGIAFSCGGGDWDGGSGLVGVEIDFSGFEVGEHQDLLVEVKHRGNVVGSWSLDQEYPVRFPDRSGCATVTVPVDLPRNAGKEPKLVASVGIGPGHAHSP